MISQIDLLILAYRLAILSFYLGVLVYALPLPYQGIKRWANILIVDSIAVAVLTLSIDSIFQLVEKITQMLGGSWAYFSSMVESSITLLSVIKGLITFLLIAPDPTGIIGGLKQLIIPIDRLVTTALYFQAFLIGVAYIVKTYGKLLAALGIVLYAVPFRITRSSGAWLIAFILIFSGGLQLLPVFVTSFQPEPLFPGSNYITENGIALAQVNVTTNFNEPVPLGLINIVKYGDNTVLASYKVENGIAVSSESSQIIPVPSKTTVYYTLEYYAVKFYMLPYPVNSSNYDVSQGVWRLTVKSPHIIYADTGILAYTTGEPLNLEKTENQIIFSVNLQSGDYVEIRVQKECQSNMDWDGLQTVSSGEWNWAEIEGTYERAIANIPGNYTVKISYLCKKLSEPQLQTHDYANIIDVLTSFFDLNFIEGFILYYFTLPSLYILILTSSAYGLARLIGGRERFSIRIL